MRSACLYFLKCHTFVYIFKEQKPYDRGTPENGLMRRF